MCVGTSTAAMRIYAPNVVVARIQQLSVQLDMDVRHPQRRVGHDLNGLLHYLLLLMYVMLVPCWRKIFVMHCNPQTLG